MFSVLCNFFLIRLKFFQNINPLDQIQDIHQGNPSRLGGMIIILFFFTYKILFLNELNIFFWCSIFIVIPAFLEDLRISIKPIVRFLTTLISCLVLVMTFPSLPQFDFEILDTFLNNRIFQIFFFTFAIATVINGQNIIDGANGLSAFSSLSIFISLLILGYHLGDNKLINTSLISIFLISSFLIFNYPFGKVFLGDAGSYFLGLLASYTVIDLFTKYPELPTFSAVTIIFYPTLEVIFSYFRKIFYERYSPFKADNKHLHLKIFYLNLEKGKGYLLSNALVAPSLCFIWLSPVILLPFSLYFPKLVILLVFFIFCIYLFLYTKIPDPRINQ